MLYIVFIVFPLSVLPCAVPCVVLCAVPYAVLHLVLCAMPCIAGVILDQGHVVVDECVKISTSGLILLLVLVSRKVWGLVGGGIRNIYFPLLHLNFDRCRYNLPLY